MKRLLVICLLAVSSVTAWADVTFEEAVESTQINGVVTMKIKRDLVHVEAPGSGTQTVMIADLARETLTTLLPKKKVKMVFSLKAMKAFVESHVRESTGANLENPPKPEPTGAKRKIGEWAAEEYTLRNGTLSVRLWLAPGAAHYKELNAELAKLHRIIVTVGPVTPVDLPGLLVRSEVTGPAGRAVMMLMSVKEGPVPDSEFEIPADYELRPAPAALGR